MSEDRIPDQAYTRSNARENGKIKNELRSSVRFEIYGAYQFSGCLDGVNFTKAVPPRREARKVFYKTMYRLRINRRWYKPGGCSYYFMDMEMFSSLLVDLTVVDVRDGEIVRCSL